MSTAANILFARKGRNPETWSELNILVVIGSTLLVLTDVGVTPSLLVGLPVVDYLTLLPGGIRG